MSAFLFLQRFENGIPVPMPYDALSALLSEYGAAGQGLHDREFCLELDEVAFGCTLVGDAAEGAICVGFERPYFDESLRKLVWACLQRFGCSAFTDSLDAIYVNVAGEQALPAEMIEASVNGVRQISGLQQLWPEELEQITEPPDYPALRYSNVNPDGKNYQRFDRGDPALQTVVLELPLCPEACTDGTTRVVISLMARVDAAIGANPPFKLSYQFSHEETPLLLLDSPSWRKTVNGATFVVPAGEAWGEKRSGPVFIADRGVFASSQPWAVKFIKHVQDKYQRQLDGSSSSVTELGALLNRLHQFYCRERDKHSVNTSYINPLITQWAVQAGSYVGEVIRQQVGGQWGYIKRGLARPPVVRTHKGSLCFPHYRVLDHIINGPSGSDIGTWFGELMQSDLSAMPRHEDLACNIPGLCGSLFNPDVFSNGGLPLPELIPVDRLDFSVDSLRHLDSYLLKVREQRQAFSVPELSNVMMAAGAYCGDVIRSKARIPGSWVWTTYDDLASENPGFAQQRPRESGFFAVLDSAESCAYPMAIVVDFLTGNTSQPTHAYVLQVLEIKEAELPLSTCPARVNNWHDDFASDMTLDQVRSALANWRKSATRVDYSGLYVSGPDWLQQDSLGEVLEQQSLLLAEGKVTWGALIQANRALLEPGQQDHPAALLYSLDPHFDSRPQALRYIASELFAQKGQKAPPVLQSIANWLADEADRAYNLPVPSLLTDRKVLISALMIFRKHLPNNVLSGAWFPILTHSSTRAVMVVPRHFWSQSLVRQWLEKQLTE